MRRSVSFCLCVVLAGCSGGSSNTPAPATPPAGGATGIVMPGGGPGGGVVTGDISDLAGSPAAATPAAAAPAEAAPAPGGPESFGTNAARLVDAAEALKNPKIVVASQKITGQDPVTAAAQAYFSIPARAQIANFQNQLRITQELNDGKPLGFDQFNELVQQLRIDFIPLPPWQMMGYDPATSELVVLEDKAEKIRLYKEKNIPLDPADVPFDTP